MRRLAQTILPGLFICASVAGQSANSVAETRSATTDAVIQQYLQALGGRAAFEKLKSRSMKGTYSLPTKNYSTPLEIYQKAPDKYAFYMTGKDNTAARGYDGGLGWSRNYSEEGLRILDGAELAADRREADFYKEIDIRKLYPVMKLKDKQTIDGHELNVIDAAAADGTRDLLYFDAQTGLLVRRDTQIFFSLNNVEVHYDNYKEVDGIKLPFTIRIVRPTAPFMTIFAFAEIKHNLKIDDAKFKKPVLK